MNYLAHACLSFNDPHILLGNMISDHVKGKKIYDYDKKILIGIKLHRRIDEFTDNHPATKFIRSFFTEPYGHYRAVFSDIVCDYFLANDITIFTSEDALKVFVDQVYQTLDTKAKLFPPGFSMMYPYMKQHNWLFNYKFHFGMQKSFAGIVRRAKYMEDSEPAFQIFKKYELKMQQAYEVFFPELSAFASDTLQQIVNTD